MDTMDTMDTMVCKVFRDSVHGYIRVPEDIVSLFVDTEIFQRFGECPQSCRRQAISKASRIFSKMLHFFP